MFKLPNLSAEQTAEMLPPNLILLGYRGSTVYGIAQPDSDKDLMGIAFEPLNCYLGLHEFEQKEAAKYNYDAVVYGLRKYVRLLLTANPTILELLWLNQNHYLHRTEAGNRLIQSRDLFVTKKCYNSFTGYAYGQLWRLDHTAPTGQMGDKRKKLVEQFGYDTKNAAHAIRLLNMGIEILTEGQLYVDRSKKDGRYLLEIRAGKFSLDAIKDEAKRLQDLAKEAYVRSDLPKDVDRLKAEELLMSITEEYIERHLDSYMLEGKVTGGGFA